MNVVIRRATTTDEIEACFPVMLALRPHLTGPGELAARVKVQAEQGYRLLAAWRDEAVVGAAGYRMQESLIRGRFCYVDDLVVAEPERRSGLGARLLDAVAAEAKSTGCEWLTLDTALDNFLGQRFYFRYRMLPAALRFGLRLD
jgi:GNAT superfamily N-acetyltransferase